jgi:hypothetical protein
MLRVNAVNDDPVAVVTRDTCGGAQAFAQAVGMLGCGWHHVTGRVVARLWWQQADMKRYLWQRPKR